MTFVLLSGLFYDLLSGLFLDYFLAYFTTFVLSLLCYNCLRMTFIAFYSKRLTSRVLCKHSNGKQVSPTTSIGLC